MLRDRKEYYKKSQQKKGDVMKKMHYKLLLLGLLILTLTACGIKNEDTKTAKTAEQAENEDEGRKKG